MCVLLLLQRLTAAVHVIELSWSLINDPRKTTGQKVTLQMETGPATPQTPPRPAVRPSAVCASTTCR